MTIDYYKIIRYTIVALVMGATIVSCKNKIETVSDASVSDLPSEEIKNIKILYTENGLAKYDFIAEVAKGYQFIDTPYYDFPKGIYGRSFVTDSVLGAIPNADITAEQAKYTKKPEFYEAYRNVVARNLIIDQRIETDTIYYDPTKIERAIYSHSPSVIIRPPDTIPALEGFFTDNQFKMYELIKVRQARVYVAVGSDSTANSKDSLQSSSTPVRHEP